MQDAAPSGDQYAIFSTALQYMLVQRVDDEDESVLLLPAWYVAHHVMGYESVDRKRCGCFLAFAGSSTHTMHPPLRVGAAVVVAAASLAVVVVVELRSTNADAAFAAEPNNAWGVRAGDQAKSN